MKEILHFTADWCNPCKRLKPLIEEYIKLHPDIKYVLVDVDTKFETAEDYNIMSVPTLVVLEDGKQIGRSSGFINYEQIVALVDGKPIN